MKKILILLAGLALFSACGNDQLNENEKTVLLTAVSWKLAEKGDVVLDKFSPDGTYIRKFGAIAMESHGKWEWVGENEISLQETGLMVNGKLEKMEVKPNDKYIIKITSLSENELVVVSRHVKDAEDSGFATNMTFTASR